MNGQKHTKLPWKCIGSCDCITEDGVDKGPFVQIVDAQGKTIFIEVAPDEDDKYPPREQVVEIAVFIVRACNNHAKLLEACKELYEATRIRQNVGAARIKARDAIAAAEKE